MSNVVYTPKLAWRLIKLFDVVRFSFSRVCWGLFPFFQQRNVFCVDIFLISKNENTIFSFSLFNYFINVVHIGDRHWKNNRLKIFGNPSVRNGLLWSSLHRSHHFCRGLPSKDRHRRRLFWLVGFFFYLLFYRCDDSCQRRLSISKFLLCQDVTKDDLTSSNQRQLWRQLHILIRPQLRNQSDDESMRMMSVEVH